MNINFDDISNTYGQLAINNPSPWDVLAGEEFRDIAQKKGVPEQKWSRDRVEIQLGLEAVMRELSDDVPQSMEERESCLRSFICRQIRCRLELEDDDVARRGMLLHAIQSAQEIDEAKLTKLSHKSLDELQEQVVDLMMTYTLDKVLPMIRHQCNMHMTEPEEKEHPNNVGAFAAACYLEVPELRSIPYVLGCESGVIQENISGGSALNLEKISYGLLLVAGILVCTVFMAVEVSVISSVAAQIFVEGTLVGVGSEIISGLAMASNVIVVMMKWALGSALLGMLAGLLAYTCESRETHNVETVGPDQHVSV